jgi:hypothetical protein
LVEEDSAKRLVWKAPPDQRKPLIAKITRVLPGLPADFSPDLLLRVLTLAGLHDGLKGLVAFLTRNPETELATLLFPTALRA